MKQLTTQFKTEILEDYKKYLASTNADGTISGPSIYFAQIALDILEIYIEKVNET